MATTTTKRPSGKARRAAAAASTQRVRPTRLRPLADRVVIKPSPREEMTSSGIVIPDTVKERPQEGTVLAVGPGRILDDGKRDPVDVRKGDKVLYAKYAATEIKLGGEDLLIVSAKDLLAIVLV